MDSSIKIKGRKVYRSGQLLGEIAGNRFPESYRRGTNKKSDFKFVAIEGEPVNLKREFKFIRFEKGVLDLSNMAYFADVCKWLKENLN